MQIDLHGYHPAEIVFNGTLAKILQQAWEMGEDELVLIHGHGRNRGISPGFVNTNTGYFGLCIRQTLRHDKSLRQWIKHTTLSLSVPFDDAATPPEMRFSFSQLVELFKEQSSKPEVISELFWASLHGIAELTRTRRFPRSRQKERVRALLELFTFPG